MPLKFLGVARHCCAWSCRRRHLGRALCRSRRYPRVAGARENVMLAQRMAGHACKKSRQAQAARPGHAAAGLEGRRTPAVLTISDSTPVRGISGAHRGAERCRAKRARGAAHAARTRTTRKTRTSTHYLFVAPFCRAMPVLLLFCMKRCSFCLLGVRVARMNCGLCLSFAR